MIKLQQLKNFFKSKTVLLFLALIVLTGLLALETFYNPKVFSQTLGDVKMLAIKLYEGNVFKEKSLVKIRTENQSLKLEFHISPKDQPLLDQFNQKLGVDDGYLEGISIDLDPVTIKKLDNFLPVELTMKVSPQNLNFSSGMFPGFASAVAPETKEFSTGSGKLRFTESSETEFKLEITDPEPLLQEATSAGKFVLSDKLKQLFPILARVSTIEVNVNGKNVNGNISIK